MSEPNHHSEAALKKMRKNFNVAYAEVHRAAELSEKMADNEKLADAEVAEFARLIESANCAAADLLFLFRGNEPAKAGE